MTTEDNAIPLMGHAMVIGMVTVAWNGAQENVFRLFHLLSGMPKPMAEAVFFSLKADSAQRDITRAVCEHTTELNEKYRQNAIDLIVKLDKLAGQRNAAVHTMWDDDAARRGSITPSTKHAAHHRSLKPDPTAQFQELTVELMKIGLGLYKCIRLWEIEHSSPDTPQPPHQPT